MSVSLPTMPFLF